MTEKSKIRADLLAIRRNLFPSVRAEKNRKIAARLGRLEAFKKAQHVLFYYSHNGEADTLALMEKYLGLKQVYLPVIHDNNQFKAVPLKDLSQLKRGAEGVPEPADPDPSVSHDEDIEVILVPGVAFGRDGSRLGMGKGYYDRYLAKHGHAVRIGLAYEEQMLDSLPKDTYDQDVDWVITDQTAYHCKP